MLLGEDRGGHQDRHLVARVHRLERRPHRHLRLPEPHVAAEEPVHGPGLGHVAAHGLHGGQLVLGLLEGEGGVELALPFGVVGEGDARPLRADRLQLEHLRGQVGDGLLDQLLLPAPGPTAQPGQLRPRPAPAQVLLHQVDLRARHVELDPLVELQRQVLFHLAVLAQELHAAVAGDAVAHVHHQLPLAQLQKTIDRPRQPARRHPPQVRAKEQLGARDQRDTVGHEPESAAQPAQGKVQLPLARRLGAGEQLGQSPHLGLGLAEDEHLLAGPGRVQLAADPGDVAAEPLDRLDPQPARRLQRARGHRGGRDQGEPPESPHHVRPCVHLARPLQPLCVAPRLFLDLLRLDEQQPARSRQVLGQVAAALLRAVDHADLHFRNLPQAPLGGNLEAADRVDLVAEQLDPHRVGPVARENVEESAAERDLAGQLDGRGGVEAVLPEPRRQLVRIEFIARPQPARVPRQEIGRRNRLHEGLDAGQEQLGRVGTGQRLEQPDTLARGLVLHLALARHRLPGGKDLGHVAREQAQVVGQIVGVVGAGADQHQRAGRVARQSGRRQRARRAPGPVQSGRLARLQARDHLAEALVLLQACGQLQELLRRSRDRLGRCHESRSF